MQTSNAPKSPKKLGFVKAVTSAINDSCECSDSGIRIGVDYFQPYMSGSTQVTTSPSYAVYKNSYTQTDQCINYDEFFSEYFVNSSKIPARKLMF